MADETYTAKELYVAFAAGGAMTKSTGKTKTEKWKEAVRRGLETFEEEQRPGNRGVLVAEFEKNFITALKAVKEERGDAASA